MNNGQTYEMGFLALSELSASDVEALQTTLVKIVESRGGQVVSQGDVHFIDLAYDMIKKVGSTNNRHNQAYFSWIKFSSATDMVEGIKLESEKQKEMLRMIVVKTINDDSVTDVFSVDIVEEESTSSDTDQEGEDQGDDVQEDTDTATNKVVSSDDLTKIEGIGPVIAQTLAEKGISTFTALADADTDMINESIAGVRGSHDSTTWSKQARLAATGKWDELQTLQDELNGGKEV